AKSSTDIGNWFAHLAEEIKRLRDDRSLTAIAINASIFYVLSLRRCRSWAKAVVKRHRGERNVGKNCMLAFNRWTAKLIPIISVSILVGFLLGNLTDHSFRPFKPFLKSHRESVSQVSFAEVSDRVNETVVSVISTKIVDFNQIHEGFEGFEFWPPARPE